MNSEAEDRLISRWHGKRSQGWEPLGLTGPASDHPAPPSPRLSFRHKLQNDHVCRGLTSNQLLSFAQKSPKVPTGVRSRRSLWSFWSVALSGCETTGSHRTPTPTPAFPWARGGGGVEREDHTRWGSQGKRPAAPLPPGGSTHSHPEGCQSICESTIGIISFDFRQQASHCALQGSRSCQSPSGVGTAEKERVPGSPLIRAPVLSSDFSFTKMKN